MSLRPSPAQLQPSHHSDDFIPGKVHGAACTVWIACQPRDAESQGCRHLLHYTGRVCRHGRAGRVAESRQGF